MWVITKDWVDSNGGQPKRPIESRDYSPLNPLINFTGRHQFRLYDGDGNLYYEGLSMNINFDPLDDFGMPNAGCTEIRYLNFKTREWEVL